MDRSEVEPRGRAPPTQVTNTTQVTSVNRSAKNPYECEERRRVPARLTDSIRFIMPPNASGFFPESNLIQCHLFKLCEVTVGRRHRQLSFPLPSAFPSALWAVCPRRSLPASARPSVRGRVLPLGFPFLARTLRSYASCLLLLSHLFQESSDGTCLLLRVR